MACLQASEELALPGSGFRDFDLDARQARLGIVAFDHDGSDAVVVRTALSPGATALHVLRHDAATATYRPVRFAGKPWLALGETAVASASSTGRLQV